MDKYKLIQYLRISYMCGVLNFEMSSGTFIHLVLSRLSHPD